ncbi:hypothetical protein NT6N_21100 [Oceaniferula spumae]|uniref:Ice-binding protein C-terminal domain-containing protein n=1 Tax=Oceaniferula spumae TaxID=2979115 RepID=A0AAT9FM76_9BACT
MPKKILLLFAATASFTHAATIGVNFLHNGTNPDDIAFGTATAGVAPYAQGNWNFMATDWSGNGVNDAALTSLVTSTGAAVTNLLPITYGIHSDRVHYDSSNTYRSGIGNGSANNTLMNGYLDDASNNQPYINISLDNTVLNATIVLYIHGDATNGPVGRYWLEDWSDPINEGTVITDQVGISSNDYNGTFISAGTYSQTGTPTNVDVATGNYIVFENITANNIRIRGAGNGDPEDFGRAPINAFQLVTVPVPEPSTTALLGLGGLALVLRRRK